MIFFLIESRLWWFKNSIALCGDFKILKGTIEWSTYNHKINKLDVYWLPLFFRPLSSTLINYFHSPHQVGAAGRKSRLLLAMSTAAEFKEHLTSFSELYASLGKSRLHAIILVLQYIIITSTHTSLKVQHYRFFVLY